jgi:hypothetical protein
MLVSQAECADDGTVHDAEGVGRISFIETLRVLIALVGREVGRAIGVEELEADGTIGQCIRAKRGRVQQDSRPG